MARFRIDDSQIDVAALEARVEAAIENKLGVRFTEAELDRLRNAELRPRLRREDLPRGLIDELSSARAQLPQLGPSPEPREVLASTTAEPDFDRHGLRVPDLPAMADGQEGGGLRGKVVRIVGRFLRPFAKAALNHDAVQILVEIRETFDRLVERDDVYLDYTERRLEGSFDLLKDDVDGRIDRTGDWVGQHLSSVTGQLEERQERHLHLVHNLVYELTNARLDLQHMQDRLNEMGRRVAMLEARERALEKLALDDK